jgi:hypothetical protein
VLSALLLFQSRRGRKVKRENNTTKVERTFGMANWRRKFSTPASSKSVSLSRSNARRKKESKEGFTFATRRMTASRAILIPRRRRGRPLNLNLDDATFGKPKSSVLPFSREHVLRFACVRARAKKRERNARRHTPRFCFPLLLFVFYGFEALRAQKASGAFVSACKCVPHSSQISLEIFVTFFFD